ncbi:hypothetical protein DFH27DRAFT_487748 [Peziza echinospora]|nr:hypothetical protein DFH27DRAFT_487748 [Peziza echinospora]
MPPAPGDYAIDDTPRALAYPARQRQAVEPPYPATPPPLASVQPEGAEYAPPPQRLPTILRAGGAHPHRHPQGPEVQPPPPLVQGAVEIGEGRELQRAEAGRRLFRSRSKTTPGSEPPSRKNSVPTDPALPPASPSSPTPSSYRNSIYSTISSLTRSLSKSLASSPASKRPTHTHSQRTENGFAILKTFDTVFLVDDSPSMLYQSRWADTFEALISISEIATQYDTDGIDIHFLNAPEHDTLGVKSPEHVREIFSRVHPVSGGSTPMGARLDELLRNYIDRYRRAREEALAAITPPVNTSGEGQQQQQQTPIIGPPRLSNLIKPLNIVVITDGDATDDPESVIVSAARELERLNAPLTQVGIQMFQVGGDPEAAEFLRGLDDDLVEVYGIRDMVDTTPYHGGGGGGGGGGGDGEEGCFTGEEMLKVLVGAVNRRVDRRENRGVGGGGGGDGGFSFAGVM